MDLNRNIKNLRGIRTSIRPIGNSRAHHHAMLRINSFIKTEGIRICTPKTLLKQHIIKIKLIGKKLALCKER